MNDKPIFKSQAKRIAVLKESQSLEAIDVPLPINIWKYREPTIEDAWQLKSIQAFSALELQHALKKLGFVRKVRP